MDFFTTQAGFTRLLTDMAAIYTRHGRTYGAVRLSKPSQVEERALSTFFERDYYDQVMIRISLGDFERQLAKKHPQISFAALLAEYLQDDSQLLYGTAHKNAFANDVKNKLQHKYPIGTPAGAWLVDVAAGTRRTYRQWVDSYQTEPDNILDRIDKTAKMLNSLPTVYTPLVNFAAQFDIPAYELGFAGEYGALFIRALAFHFNAALIYSAESAVGLYLKARILTNEVLCQVVVQNINAFDASGITCAICDTNNTNNNAYVLTLENIVHYSNITCDSEQVYIIEDLHTFAAVRERLHGTRGTIICPMGKGNNPAFILLLEKLAADGRRLYFSGNMDFKSLMLADELYKKFGKQLIPWRYTKQDYQLAIMTNSALLSGEKRELAMHNEDLALVLSQIRKHGRTASSLPLVPLMVDDIKAVSQNS